MFYIKLKLILLFLVPMVTLIVIGWLVEEIIRYFKKGK